MISFNVSTSIATRDSDVTTLYYLVLSYHIGRHMKIVQQLCATRWKGSIKIGVGTTITIVLKRNEDLWQLTRDFECSW